MKLYTLKEVSEITGYAQVTLRKWIYDGKLTSIKSKGGHHRLTEEMLNNLLGVKRRMKDRIVVGYCRVLSREQEEDLSRQIESVREYMLANGYSFEIIKDIGSGMNYKNPGLIQVTNKVINGEVDRVVILYQDRLVRVGFELLEFLFSRFNVGIEIIDNTKGREDEELEEEMIQLLKEFSPNLQKKKAQRVKRLIEELEEEKS